MISAVKCFLLAPVLFVFLSLTLLDGRNACAEIVTFEEDFTSWQYRNAALSTAWWDTLSGEIKLYPLAIDEQSVLPTSGTAFDVTLSGEFAFIADGAGGLVAVDVSDPLAPLQTDVLATSDNARGVAVAGSYAYVAIGSDGLQIVAVGDPSELMHVGATELNGFAYAVAVDGDYAYLATANIGLSVVRVVEAGDPILVDEEASTDWAQDVALWQHHAYLADGNGGLSIIDISNPPTPVLVGNLDTAGYCYGVSLDYPLVYLADGAGGLVIADVSLPNAPQEIATLPLDGTARGVANEGSYVYVAAGTAGLQVIEVSDPADPLLRGGYDSVGDARAVVVDGQLVYLADGAGGLAIVKVDPDGFNTSADRIQSVAIADSSDPIARARLACSGTDTVHWDLSVDGGLSWENVVADDSWYAFAEPGTTLHWRATLAYGGGPVGPSCHDLSIDYDILHSYADIIAVDDIPEDSGGQVRVSWSASRFDVVGSETTITEYSVYRRIADDEREALPFYPPGDWDYLMTVPADAEQQYAVVAPTLADSTVVDGIYWSVFFVRARSDQYGQYFDSPPDSGYSLNNLRPDQPTGFVLLYDAQDGNQLAWDPYAADDLAHFRIYRSEQPDFEPLPGNLLQIVHDTSYVDSGGLGEGWYYRLTAVVLDGSESYPVAPREINTAITEPAAGVPTATRLLAVFPNPFNPTVEIHFAVAATAAPASAAIYDLRGRRVRNLGKGFAPGESHRLRWDGRDGRGHSLPSGLYYCRLVSGATVDTRKLTLAR